ncbi:Homeobox-leucine zipper protein HDG1 [Linum grandiflorum]
MEGQGTADGRIIIGGQSFDVNNWIQSSCRSNTNVFQGHNSSSDDDDSQEAQNQNQNHNHNQNKNRKKNKKKKMKHHRHTQFQLAELEKLFNENTHPDSTVRLELSRKLGLQARQVKFWFQNRRTQVKKNDTIVMKEQNEKLRAENEMMKQSLNHLLCNNCGGTEIPAIVSQDQKQLLRLDHARLMEEFDRVCSMVADKLLAVPFAPNGSQLITNVDATPPSNCEVFLDFVLAAMSELFMMVQTDEPLWMKLGGDREMLNVNEYARISLPSLRLNRSGFVTEASRETISVMMPSFAVVDMLMNVMQADLQVISPMVPARRERFLRFCKQHSENVWVVVDVSLDASQQGSSSNSFLPSVRFPSGCIIQGIQNGYSKVTWVEHSQYDEASIDPMLRPVISSGIGFSAKRWLSSLQRFCDFLSINTATSSMPEDPLLLTGEGKKSVMRLAKSMVDNFCSGVVSNGDDKWDKLLTVNNIKILASKGIIETEEASGFVLAASTSVWLPYARERLFDLLSQNSASWSLVTKYGEMQELSSIPKGYTPGNGISLLRGVFRSLLNRYDNMSQDANGMAVLQEMWHNDSESLVVYAPVSVASIEMVIGGGDHTLVGLLPSGYVILPDGPEDQQNFFMATTSDGNGHGRMVKTDGSILTMGLQIVINTLHVNDLITDCVEMVNTLVASTIQRIQDTL